MSKKILVISGPSGVGKTTLCERLLKLEPRLQACVTATTRLPRPNEINGQDYYFVSRSQFNQWIKQQELLEYTRIFGEYYGTPKKSLNRIFRQGKYPLLRIDVRGAQKLRQLNYRGLFIFIRPPDLSTLTVRLRKRAQKDGVNTSTLKTRLKRVTQELKMSNQYDFQVVNDKLNRAIKETRNILKNHLFKPIRNHNVF